MIFGAIADNGMAPPLGTVVLERLAVAHHSRAGYALHSLVSGRNLLRTREHAFQLPARLPSARHRHFQRG